MQVPFETALFPWLRIRKREERYETIWKEWVDSDLQCISEAVNRGLLHVSGEP